MSHKFRNTKSGEEIVIATSDLRTARAQFSDLIRARVDAQLAPEGKFTNTWRAEAKDDGVWLNVTTGTRFSFMRKLATRTVRTAREQGPDPFRGTILKGFV